MLQHTPVSAGGLMGQSMGTGFFLAYRNGAQHSLGSGETPRCWLALGTLAGPRDLARR